MERKRSVKWAVPLLVLALAGCATETKVSKASLQMPAKPADCDIHIFKDSKPDRPYAEMNKIESHLQRNIFFGGSVTLDNEGMEELREKGCALGGDAVLIDDFVETHSAELTHVHVWATVVKYTGAMN